MAEPAISEWKNIAAFFGVSLSKMKSHREELRQLGVIFYTIKGRKKQKTVCAFPDRLMRWASIKSRKDEII